MTGTVFIAVTPHMRRVLASLTENLIEFLDAIDGDEDREEGADIEPVIGWPEAFGLSQLRGDICHDEEREDVSEDEGAACDDEGNNWGEL